MNLKFAPLQQINYLQKFEMDLEEVLIDVPWGKISVLCRGEVDWPTVVMLHGNQDSASTFFPLLEYFPKKLRLIIPELPSCGNSTPFPIGRPLNVLDFISPIKMVVDHFELEKFTYIGHSMGFQIGYFFNAIYPEHVTKFISLDSVSYPPVEPSMFPSWFKWTYENFYEPSNYIKFSSPGSAPKYTYEKALASVMKNRNLTEAAGKAVLMRSLIPAGDGLFTFCWDQRLKLVNMPLFDSQYQLTVFGKMKIPHLTLIASESAKKRFPSVKLHMLEAHFVNNPYYRLVMVEGNHDVHLNDPKMVASHVVPFLNGEDASKEETYRLVHLYKKMWDDKENETVKSKL